jgi:hypothetical protein
MNVAPALLDVVAREAAQPLPTPVEAFVAAARTRFGAATAAIVFYGSCRRQDQPDSLYDLYVILDTYRALPGIEAILAACLPPNVYYLEVATPNGVRRAKCTVISRADFARGNARWFHSYLWGRFCQPVSLAYARDAAVRGEILHCLGVAVTTFMKRVLCLLDGEFDTRSLWVVGLRISYNTELRSEGPDRAAELYATHTDYYEAATAAAAPALGLLAPAPGRWRAPPGHVRYARGRWGWRVRSVTGKFLALARILKASITFDGGLDYIVWKLARHAGRDIEIPERVRRNPALHMWGFFWRLYRDGVFR